MIYCRRKAKAITINDISELVLIIITKMVVFIELIPEIIPILAIIGLIVMTRFFLEPIP